ncbi:hypothetical protein HPP92_006761 [Vanilla planifolia]|uniref:RNA polymerase II subunit 5-mediating protein homolog n=1 Tax=Vanilla planifolia TaxID=51239 RepID=A0A835RG82_VANPL|nr:hypothetical protein HPP92_006761 [Vanilla planifolia]
MADGQEKKGTVTLLSSLFSAKEAEKAVRRVQEAISDRQKELDCLREFLTDNKALIQHAISDRQKELDRLREFLTDNKALIQHVQKLPEELSHDIMVPFGGAAFFPGRLIHTNELMVLLGEGYYAERSAKQTVEILQRRGKSLEAQLESLKRIVKDLELEAKFFDSAATEAAEGVVHIREEYVEDAENQQPGTDKKNSEICEEEKEEEEYAKLMARLNELEKEEEEAGSDLAEDEYDETARTSDEYEEDEESEDEEEDTGYMNAKAKNHKNIYEEVPLPLKVQERSMQHDASKWSLHPSDQPSVHSKVHVFPTGSLENNLEQLHMTCNPSQPLKTNEYLQKAPNVQASSESSSSTSSSLGSSTERKAFTGSVIEHSYGLSLAQPTNSADSGQSSRPVSRFKLQKGGR